MKIVYLIIVITKSENKPILLTRNVFTRYYRKYILQLQYSSKSNQLEFDNFLCFIGVTLQLVNNAQELHLSACKHAQFYNFTAFSLGATAPVLKFNECDEALHFL